MAGYFDPVNFLARWKIVIADADILCANAVVEIVDQGELYSILSENSKLDLGHAGMAYTTATLEKDDFSVSFWQRGAGRIMAIRARTVPREIRDPRNLHFAGQEGRVYSMWGCELQEADTTGEPSILTFTPSFEPCSVLEIEWLVQVEFGDSGGRDGHKVKISRNPLNADRYDLCYYENDCWKTYDTLVYNQNVGSFDSICGYRSICYWAEKQNVRDKKVIYAMFDSSPAKGSDNHFLMPFEENILQKVRKWRSSCEQEEESSVGVWGAEEGGGGAEKGG